MTQRRSNRFPSDKALIGIGSPDPDYDNGCYGLLLQADGGIVVASWMATDTYMSGANLHPSMT